MIQYGIQVNKDQVADAISLFEFIGGNTDNAIRVAINKAAPKVRTLSSRAIRSQVRLKAAYVNERLKILKATRQKLRGVIQTPSRGLLLSKFSTDTQIASDNTSWIKPPPVPAQGIKVKVKPSGPTKKVQGDSETTGQPFYIVLKNTRQIGIAARRDTPGPHGGKIKVFHGPSISQVFNTVRDDVLPQASDEYQNQLIDAMRYLLAKKYPAEV